MRKRAIVAVLLCVLCIAIGAVVGKVYAAYYLYDVSTSQLDMRGWGANDITLDIDGDEDWTAEALVYLQPTKGGMFWGTGTVIDGPNHIWEDRAEAAVGRVGSGEDANAWVQSSANAKVMCRSDGDIVITIGF